MLLLLLLLLFLLLLLLLLLFLWLWLLWWLLLKFIAKVKDALDTFQLELNLGSLFQTGWIVSCQKKYWQAKINYLAPAR